MSERESAPRSVAEAVDRGAQEPIPSGVSGQSVADDPLEGNPYDLSYDEIYADEMAAARAEGE